jgi:hypothetical protein
MLTPRSIAFSNDQLPVVVLVVAVFRRLHSLPTLHRRVVLLWM